MITKGEMKKNKAKKKRITGDNRTKPVTFLINEADLFSLLSTESADERDEVLE